MLFNSYPFIFIFLPLTLISFFTLAKLGFLKAATAALVIASLIFYANWDIRYLPLLLASIGMNFLIGKQIEKAILLRQKKTFILLGIVLDLALIIYYKYAFFFGQTLSQIFQTSFSLQQLSLPLGISFYTFTQIAYLVDAYRRETPGYDFLTYSLFVTFFPHLIAGPILYHKKIIPQFLDRLHFTFNPANFAMGVVIFTIGLGKKILIADQLIPWIKPIFLFPAQYYISFFQAWTGALAYSYQLYFDFSGYSDMAIGLGLMLNIMLPLNFNSPYQAKSIIEFWQRWHISLSDFLKNYLYIPLGGNRHGQWKKLRNLMLTMLIGGLWHGAGWTYVLWGGLHGLYLVINHNWHKFSCKLPPFLSWLITFLAVIIAWVFFRSSSPTVAVQMVSAMFGAHGLGHFPPLDQWLTLILLTAGILYLPNSQTILEKLQPKWYWAFAVSILLAVSLISLNQGSEFLYFQF